MKFGFDWPSGFGGDLKRWLKNGRMADSHLRMYLLLAHLVRLTTQAEPNDSRKLKRMACTNFGHIQHLQQLIYTNGGVTFSLRA